MGGGGRGGIFDVQDRFARLPRATVRIRGLGKGKSRGREEGESLGFIELINKARRI